MEKENQISLSCRKVFIRHLRIFVSTGTVNERKKIRRSRITNFRDDRPLFYNGKAFTLIELLVVVLIIGILAAVALPQYQKAVEKSKGVQALALLKTLGEAANVYYLANGTWPTKFEQLDVDIPEDWTGDEEIYSYATTDARSNGEWSIILGNESQWEHIMIGRINGKYAGGGFSWEFKPNAWAFQGKQEIRCIEVRSKFHPTAGSYCKELFKGSLHEHYAQTPVRIYVMP